MYLFICNSNAVSQSDQRRVHHLVTVRRPFGVLIALRDSDVSVSKFHHQLDVLGLLATELGRLAETGTLIFT